MAEKVDIRELDRLVGAAESAGMAYQMIAFSKHATRPSKATFAQDAGIAADRVAVWLGVHEPDGKLSRECWGRRATRYYAISYEWSKGK